ncbi:hypothetical protein [Microcella sp.]|uniref:hypothetical protein n=1 Tax=Microcella sp. TaxID=1913979 RepID=UPI00256E8F63|nr:hypothetical protein [Microcella sp.]MBX9470882.1 hypothetical protein [Microcella sp.]
MTSPLRLPRPLDQRLAPAELQSALLDGELVRLGTSFLGLDEPDSPRERARSLAPVLGDVRAIVCDRSAAWVWGWVPPPAVASTCVSIDARVASPVRRRLRAREAVLDRDEVVWLDDVRVTAPVRTVIDLARHDDDDDDATEAIEAALRSSSVTAAELNAAVHRRPGIAYVRRAQRRIDRAISRC